MSAKKNDGLSEKGLTRLYADVLDAGIQSVLDRLSSPPSVAAGPRAGLEAGPVTERGWSAAPAGSTELREPFDTADGARIEIVSETDGQPRIHLSAEKPAWRHKLFSLTVRDYHARFVWLDVGGGVVSAELTAPVTAQASLRVAEPAEFQLVEEAPEID
jgi:hypothetical protein